MTKRNTGVSAIIVFTLVAIIHFIHFENWVNLPHLVLVSLRWIFIAVMIIYALAKKSLTTWILTSMVIGIEIGLDFPAFSQNLQFLSKIFLRLVKTIVAPLLFAYVLEW